MRTTFIFIGIAGFWLASAGWSTRPPAGSSKPSFTIERDGGTITPIGLAAGNRPIADEGREATRANAQ